MVGATLEENLVVLSFANGIFSPDSSVFSSNYISISPLRGLPLLPLSIEMFYFEVFGLPARGKKRNMRWYYYIVLTL